MTYWETFRLTCVTDRWRYRCLRKLRDKSFIGMIAGTVKRYDLYDVPSAFVFGGGYFTI